MSKRLTIAVLTAVMILTGAVSALAYGGFGDWSQAEDIETFGAGAHENFNLPTSTEGCPFISPDGKMFFMASNRGSGQGGLDIWVSTRASATESWGEPVNLGEPINSAFNDFCPTIARDGVTFFFASNRPGGCGGADIYTTRFGPGLATSSVTNLGCEVNSSNDEHSPFPSEIPGKGPVLFYSSDRPLNSEDTIVDHDLYMSPMQGGAYGAGTALPGLNTDAGEGQPNVSRDGQELFFWSNRTGGEGGQDIWSATKDITTGVFGNPQNLGSAVNGAGNESRPSLSWDGTTLYFGSTRSGVQDIYVTTR